VTNYCDWNSTENAIKGVDVANAMLEIATNPGFASMSQSEWDEGVKSGEVIACISGVWDETTMKEAWQDSYAACKLPTYNCAGTQVQMACFFGYKTVGVNPYSEHLEWAQKFADYIANEENQKLRFEMRGQGPSNLNAADSPEVQATAAIQAVLAQSEFSELQRIGNNYWTPTATYGNTLATGNPDGIDLQELLDSTVESIVSSTVQ
jgi:arabinogalactan oligomer/maltooligosaccharide transport system substrate-binding protein